MSLTVQLQTMLAMVAMGGWIGMSIDTYSRLIRGRSWKQWVTFINDSLFWIIQGLVVFFALLFVNEGEMRFYVLLALLCGYAAYRALFYQMYLKFLEAMIRLLVQTYKFIKAVLFTLIINPTKGLLKLLYTVCMMVISFTISVIIFLLQVIAKPFIWLGKGIWRLVPKQKLEKFKKHRGFLKKMKKYIKQWFKKE